MDKVLTLLLEFEGTIDSAFSPYIVEIQAWITAIIAIAFLLYMIFTVILPMMSGRAFDLSKLMVMLVLYGMFKMYPTLIKSVDNFFQIPADSAMMDVKNEMKSINLILTKPTTNPNPVNIMNIPSATLNAIQQIPMSLYMIVIIVGLYVLFAIVVLIKLASVVAANVIMVLGTIPFALSFLPGFSGGIPSVIKNLLAVRLWPFVSALIFKVIVKIGVLSAIIEQADKLNQMQLDPSKLQSWDYDMSAIILLIVAMFLLIMTPKFVDLALNVSTSAGGGSLIGASSMVGGISSLGSSTVMTSIQSAMGMGDGGQQKTQNEILTDISKGIDNLNKKSSNTNTGGESANSSSEGVDKSTIA